MEIIGILVVMFVLVKLWNLGVFMLLSPKVITRKKLSKDYGGVYVFYPELMEEIKERLIERSREHCKLDGVINKKVNERMKKEYGFTDEDLEAVITPQGDYFKKEQYRKVQDEVFDQVYGEFRQKYPQTIILSNGYEYNCDYAKSKPYDPKFDHYYEKIREFMGEKVYEKIKYSLRLVSSYRCKDGSEGPITVYTSLHVRYKQFGLTGDSGAGFRLTTPDSINIPIPNSFELRNGKFEKVDKEYDIWY